MVTVVNKISGRTVVKQVICKSCGSTLEYVPNEIRQDYTTDYTGDRDYYNYIKCPECTNVVIIK